jgi:HD-GYP domain-containing protein (c-di-GMP phosphodiesterase class II)
MKIIDVSELKPGTVSPFNCYSETGDLLVSKGVVISQKHIDVLLRRNISTIFSGEHEDDADLGHVPDLKINNLDDLLDKQNVPDATVFSDQSQHEGVSRLAMTLPDLKDVKAGEAGFIQMLSTPKVEEVENRIQREIDRDKPSGAPLAAKARQMTIKERTDEYKTSVITTYASALDETIKVLREIIDCKFFNFLRIKGIVDTFIKTFISDKNILLNISATKPGGEEYFFNHSLNVCLLAINIAASAKYSEKQISEIGIGALLHDIGMLLVPNGIRFKKGKLTEEEMYEVRKHPILGLHIIEKIENMPSMVSSIVYQSHERENGKGYPKQRTGRFIHNYAKIVQIADIFESMSSKRPYRNSFLPYKAMEALVKMAHDGIVNSDYVKCFLSYMSLFPVGSLVELSDNRIGKVIQANGALFAKPVVSILAEKGIRISDKSRIYQEDLKKSNALQIIRPVPGDAYQEIEIMDGF